MPSTAAPPRTPVKTVLVVDDSATIRSLIKIYLMNRRVQFLDAATGVEALSLLASQSVDLVLSDFNMPSMDGVAFTEAVRHSGRRDTPLVMMTANTDPALEARASAAGANAFLRKPLTVQALMSAVDPFLPA
nr:MULTISPECIES: response regulator [Myxococcaceae]